jgi:hypothetical protein
MAGLDPAIQAATLDEDHRSAPHQFLRRHNLDGRVKPGHDDGKWFNSKATRSSMRGRAIGRAALRLSIPLASPCARSSRRRSTRLRRRQIRRSVFATVTTPIGVGEP